MSLYEDLEVKVEELRKRTMRCLRSEAPQSDQPQRDARAKDSLFY